MSLTALKGRREGEREAVMIHFTVDELSFEDHLPQMASFFNLHVSLLAHPSSLLE